MKKIILAGFSAILCAASFLSHAVTPQEFTIPNDDLNIVYTGSWANGSDSAILALPPSHNSYHQGQGTAAGNTGTAYIPISGDNGSTYRPSLSFIATPEGSSNVLVRVHYLDSFGVGQTHDVYVNMYNTGDVRIGLSLGEYNGLQGVEIFDSMPNQCALTSCDIVTFDHLTVVDLTAKDNSSAYQSGQPYTFPNAPIGATIGSYKRITFGENGFEIPDNLLPGFKQFKYLGASTAAIGDVDGNGVSDIFTYVEGGRSSQGSSPHSFALLLMNSDGTVHDTIPYTVKNSYQHLTPVDRTTSSPDISPLGDFDGNGVPDVLIGVSSYGTDPIQGSGFVQLVLLNANGTIKKVHKISSNDGNLNFMLNRHYAFGSSVTALNDVDNNGVIDLMVTFRNGSNEYYYDTNSDQVPQLLLLMETDGSVKQTIEVLQNNASNFHLKDLSYIRYWGDMDNDGNPDFVAVNSYKNQLVFMKLDASNQVHQQNVKVISTDYTLSNFVSVTDLKVIGDVNGDGINDIALGDSSSNSNQGGIHVICLDVNGNEITSYYYPLSMSNDHSMGSYGAISSIGDLNGDSKAELVVGSLNYDGSESTNQGAIYILFSQ